MFLKALLLFSGLWSAASALPTTETLTDIAERADSSLVGYFFVHFYDREPSIFAHLSNGNEPLSYRELNGDAAIITPTLGTGGARDPYLISAPDNSKHWILATDLDIATTNWDAATRTGSRSIFIWESTDLVNWGNERLVELAPSTAGMVWAPEAIATDDGQYLVHWSSRFYDSSDTAHSGDAVTIDQIWYSYTSDFITFTEAQPYIAIDGIPIIDLTILPLPTAGEYVRYIKNEDLTKVWAEHTTGGLFGTWERLTAEGTYVIDTVAEGPLVFWDNEVEDKVHVFLDLYTTASGYVAFETDNVLSGTLTQSSTQIPTLLKHGVVKPVTQDQYDTISSKWPA